MAILPKAIYRFDFNPYQITSNILQRTGSNGSNIHKETQKTRIAKAILRKQNKVGEISLPNFKLYYKARVIKTFDTDRRTEPQTSGTD